MAAASGHGHVIDAVVQHRPIGELWFNTILLLAALSLNYPFRVLFVRCLSGTVRRMGAGLRSALCGRMRQLPIGYHSRMSAGVLQNKVIRDVENVEQMVQQAGDMGLAASMMLIGGLVVIAIRVPVFLPVFVVLVPCAALLAMKLRKRRSARTTSSCARTAPTPGSRPPSRSDLSDLVSLVVYIVIYQ